MTVEFLSCHEVLQALVVYLDLYWALGSFQEMSSLFQCADNSEHLFVMDLIVPLYQRQEFAVKGHQVPFLLSEQLLREDGSRGKVGAISLDAKEF